MSPTSNRQLDVYAQALLATGMEEREVARAVFYVEHYGFEAMKNDDCVTFDEPSCGDWDCVRPDHQVLVKH